MKTHHQQCILMKLLDEAVSDALKKFRTIHIYPFKSNRKF